MLAGSIEQISEMLAKVAAEARVKQALDPLITGALAGGAAGAGIGAGSSMFQKKNKRDTFGNAVSGGTAGLIGGLGVGMARKGLDIVDSSKHPAPVSEAELDNLVNRPTEEAAVTGLWDQVTNFPKNHPILTGTAFADLASQGLGRAADTAGANGTIGLNPGRFLRGADGIAGKDKDMDAILAAYRSKRTPEQITKDLAALRSGHIKEIEVAPAHYKGKVTSNKKPVMTELRDAKGGKLPKTTFNPGDLQKGEHVPAQVLTRENVNNIQRAGGSRRGLIPEIMDVFGKNKDVMHGTGRLADGSARSGILASLARMVNEKGPSGRVGKTVGRGLFYGLPIAATSLLSNLSSRSSAQDRLKKLIEQKAAG